MNVTHGLIAVPGLERRRAVFFDKDGTLIEKMPFNADPARMTFTPHALTALRRLDAAGFALVVVTNQPGLATGHFARVELVRLERALTERVRDEAGVMLTGFYACPHPPGEGDRPACLCRKPAAGLLRQAALTHRIDLARSWMVGDTLDDVEAGRRAGARSVLLDVGNETQWRITPLRTPHHRVADLLEAAELIVGQARPAVDAALPVMPPHAPVDSTHRAALR